MPFLSKLRPRGLALLSAALLLLSGCPGTWAQTPTTPLRGGLRCGFDSLQQAAFDRHPGSEAAYRQFLAQVAREAARQPAAARAAQQAAPDITIPVVVHVVFGPNSSARSRTGISDAQVEDALRIANLDFSKTNADTAAVIPPFRDRVANVGFRFRLAKLDPNGNCTTGITRTYTRNSEANDDAALKRQIHWDPARYLNIWIVDNSALATNLGYATLPCTGGNGDGVVIRRGSFGSIEEAANTNSARTLTHELGHYFGLLHTFGLTNSAGQASNCALDDGVADTPKTIGTFGCDLAFTSCPDPQTGQPVLANVQNHLDYASCRNMFTVGQRAVMRASLALDCRRTLSTAANLAATGTADGYQAPACPPVVSIGTLQRRVCADGFATLFVAYGNTAALNDAAAQCQWSFPGGVPATATGREPRVSYPTPGVYDVSVTITPTDGSAPVSRTEPRWMAVDGPGTGLALSGGLNESFEDPRFPRTFGEVDLRNWRPRDTTSWPLERRWQRVSGGGLVAADGVACLVVPNSTVTPTSGWETYISSPALDLSGFQGRPLQLSFRTATAATPTIVGSIYLIVYYGTDCELSSSTPRGFQRFSINDLKVAGQPPQNGFVPTSIQQWTTLTMLLDPQYIGPSTWVRFSFGSSGGNPVYLDQVRIQEATGPLGTAAATAAVNFGVYPNPLTAETAVHFTLPAAGRAAVQLTDLLGREVARVPARSYPAGSQAIRLPSPADGRALPAGLYLVRLNLDEQTLTGKLLVP